MNALPDWTIAWLTLRQLFVRRRLIAAILFAAAPGLIAILYRAGHDATQNAVFLEELYRDLVLWTLLPLTAVILGSAAFGSEIDDGTILYLLVKPLARWRIVLATMTVALMSTVAVILVGLLLPWLVLGPAAIGTHIVVANIAALGVGAVIYTALFVMLGLTSRRGLLAGLLYVVVIEFVMSHTVEGIKSLSVREFVTTIVSSVAPDASGVVAGTVSLTTVWVMGGIAVAGSVALAIRWLSRYEMAEQL